MNVLSINSFNLEMIMGSHLQFYARLYHSVLLLSKGLRWYQTETSANEARGSKVWLRSLRRGDAAQSRVLAAPRGRRELGLFCNDCLGIMSHILGVEERN